MPKKSTGNSLNSVELLYSLRQVFWAFGLIGCFCELGEMVTKLFDKFNVRLYQCDWYLFPIEVQRMLVVFMSDTQQPVFVHASGNIQCIRENFKKVKNIFSNHRFLNWKKSK